MKRKLLIIAYFSLAVFCGILVGNIIVGKTNNKTDFSKYNESDIRDNEDKIHALRSYAFSNLGIYIKELDAKNIHISKMDAFEVSSSEIREKIKSGKSVYGIVEPEIIEYMESHKLYGYRQKQWIFRDS